MDSMALRSRIAVVLPEVEFILDNNDGERILDGDEDLAIGATRR